MLAEQRCVSSERRADVHPVATAGGRGKSFQGERYLHADNPPYGATITWYLKEGIKTKKEKAPGSRARR
jgi:hypothetical protein